MTEFTADATDTAANLALMLGPAVLARIPKAAAAWEATKTALYAKVASGLETAVQTVEPVTQALNALRGIVKPGYWLTNGMMSKLPDQRR